MRVWWSNCRIFAKRMREKRGGSTMYSPSQHIPYIDHYRWVARTGYIYEFGPLTYDRGFPDWLNKWIPPLPIFKGTIRICGKITFKEEPPEN